MVTTTFDVTELHPALLAVNVSVTVVGAAFCSVVEGLYVVAVLPGVVNVPDPPDQATPVCPVAVPTNAAAELFAQTVAGEPALTVGAGVYVNTTLSFASGQSTLPVVVIFNLTDPVVISAAAGVYVAFFVVLFGTKVPAPPLQRIPGATV